MLLLNKIRVSVAKVFAVHLSEVLFNIQINLPEADKLLCGPTGGAFSKSNHQFSWLPLQVLLEKKVEL